MVELKRGMIVKSLAGHDKTQLFVIMDTDTEYVYLADGKLRSCFKPKRKRKKHIQPTKHIDEFISESGCIEDSYIRKILKSFAVKQEC